VKRDATSVRPRAVHDASAARAATPIRHVDGAR
jgi:hypothetical protein